jgi:hypothetical protein
MKIKSSAILTVLVSGFIAFLPKVHAVSPPPDGGYPGGNTAEGQNALLSQTTGGFNTAIGFLSLRTNATGQLNTAIGAGTLLANTADNNTAAGAAALFSNSTGTLNTAAGAFALFSNTTGGFNTANGFEALLKNTTGGNNTANGVNALFNNTTGGINTAIGVSALLNNTTGNLNTALGAGAGINVLTADNVICVGNSGADVSNTTWIGNVYGTTTISATTLPVVVSDSGQLGTASSSARFKKEIKPMDKASETILALKPVTFQYRSDNTNTPQFGLIAEQVAEVNPDLVVRDKNGEIYSVRYDQVNAMLLNEFLKEHKAFREEQRKVKKLEAALAAVNEQLKAQETKIEKVSAQLDMSRAAPQIIANNQ